jgi:hypothetical protein
MTFYSVLKSHTPPNSRISYFFWITFIVCVLTSYRSIIIVVAIAGEGDIGNGGF